MNTDANPFAMFNVFVFFVIDHEARVLGRVRAVPVVAQVRDRQSFVSHVAQVRCRPILLLPVAQALGRPRVSRCGCKTGELLRAVFDACAAHRHLLLKVLWDAEPCVKSCQASAPTAAARHAGRHAVPFHACQDAVQLSTFALELLRGDLQLACP